MRRFGFTLSVLGFLVLGPLGCGDDSGGGDKELDAQVPEVTVTLEEPGEASLLAGTVEVIVRVEGDADEVLLLVDDEPVASLPVTGASVTLSWDSTLVSDGTHELKVVAGKGGRQVGISEPRSVTVDNTPPDLDVAGLERPFVFDGPRTFQVQANDAHPGRVSLLVDGSEAASQDGDSAALEWDPNGREDGAVQLSFVARDAAGNETRLDIRGVVVLEGELLQYTDGDGTGFFSVPANYTPGTEIDQKFHWEMPEGVTRLLGVLQWEQDPEAPWQFELALGSGFCPHSGTVLGAEEGDTGQVLVSVEAEDGPFATGQHFAHMGPGSGLDPSDRKGQSVRFWMLVFRYPPAAR